MTRAGLPAAPEPQTRYGGETQPHHVAAIAWVTMHVRAQWQCLLDPERWHDEVEVWADYSAAYNDKIEATWRAATEPGSTASPLYYYRRRSFSWIIDTQNWQQQNIDTGTIRRIRRILVPENFHARHNQGMSGLVLGAPARPHPYPSAARYGTGRWKPARAHTMPAIESGLDLSDRGHSESARMEGFLVVDQENETGPSPYVFMPGEELQPRLHHEELRSRPRIAGAGAGHASACLAYEDAWAPYVPGERKWSRGHQRMPANLPAGSQSAQWLQAQPEGAPAPPDDPWAEGTENC